eukprot:82665_1
MQHISLLIIITISTLYECDAYKMDPYITCFENNVERPIGFKESLTYLDNAWCNATNNSNLCSIYRNIDPYKGKGDVCDHTDSTTDIIRNACKMEITFGPNETTTKTWSWKCIELSTCTLKDSHGIARTGCKYTKKRINCCCNEYDYCNGDNDTSIGQFYRKLAAFGREDHFPIDFTKLLSIAPDNVYVEIDSSVPGYKTFQYGNITQEETITTTLPPIKNITTCNHDDNLIDIMLLVDSSCPIDFEQCEQQQEFIADIMASLRGIDTINASDSIMSQVRIAYIKFAARGESTVIIDFVSNNSLNVDIIDPELARAKIYNIIKDSQICNNARNGGGTNLLNGLNKAYDLFDDIDDGSIENSTSDKILLIFSNCGVINRKDVNSICNLYSDRYREDMKIIMVNNNADVNGFMSDPDTYMECLVDDDLNRIIVVDDSDNDSTETICRIQTQVCQNITSIDTTFQPQSTILTTLTIPPITTIISSTYTTIETTTQTTILSTEEITMNPSMSSTYTTETSEYSTTQSTLQTTEETIESTITLKTTVNPSIHSTLRDITQTSNVTHQPTVSPTIYCDEIWLIAFKMKLLKYNQTDIKWKNNLKLALLNAFKQTINSTIDIEWNMNWCIGI